MFGQQIAISILSIVGLASAAPGAPAISKRCDDSSNGTVADRYVPLRGDGSAQAGWPSVSQWGSFDALWKANYPLMQKSCGWNNWGADNSEAEINGIKTAIQRASQATGVDSRFILAIVMQESKGCVRVPTTNNGVVNPGLMQSHNGSGTCAGVNPCPQWQINQMVADGTAGTWAGDGLKQIIARVAPSTGGSSNSRTFYATARTYNSGSANLDNLQDGRGSTACYASDVANRLTGWTLAASQCTPY